MPKKVTQTEVARVAGITEGTLSRYSRGERKLARKTEARVKAARLVLAEVGVVRDEILAKLDRDFLEAAIRASNELAELTSGRSVHTQ